MGAAIVLNTLFGGTTGSGAYAAAQTAAGVFGVVMFVVGVRVFLKACTTLIESRVGAVAAHDGHARGTWDAC